MSIRRFRGWTEENVLTQTSYVYVSTFFFFLPLFSKASSFIYFFFISVDSSSRQLKKKLIVTIIKIERRYISTTGKRWQGKRDGKSLLLAIWKVLLISISYVYLILLPPFVFVALCFISRHDILEWNGVTMSMKIGGDCLSFFSSFKLVGAQIK